MLFVVGVDLETRTLLGIWLPFTDTSSDFQGSDWMPVTEDYKCCSNPVVVACVGNSSNYEVDVFVIGDDHSLKRVAYRDGFGDWELLGRWYIHDVSIIGICRGNLAYHSM